MKKTPGEINNKINNTTLAILLVGAIAVSLLGTLISLNKVAELRHFPGYGGLTGMANKDNGTVQLNIQSSMSLTVARNVDFGPITPNSTSLINISTDANLLGRGGIYDCSVIANCSGLEIENDGNVPINVTMNSSSDATDLIGGTNPVWRFYVASGNSSNPRGDTGCSNIPAPYGTPWQTFQKNTNYTICYAASGGGGLWHNDTNDTMTIEFNLTIPSDAAPGSKTAYLQFWNDP